MTKGKRFTLGDLPAAAFAAARGLIPDAVERGEDGRLLFVYGDAKKAQAEVAAWVNDEPAPGRSMWRHFENFRTLSRRGPQGGAR